MASVLQRVAKRLSDVAGNAREKSKELLDSAKLGKRARELEAEIRQLKMEIGEQFYTAYRTGTEPVNLQERCEQIDSLREELTELHQELDRIRGTFHCPYCNEELDNLTTYCPFCGSKLEAMQ